MSVLNCGSFTPKLPPLVNSSQEFHSPATGGPAISARSTDAPTAHPPAAAADDLVVALDELVLRARRPERRRQPIGDDEVHPHQQEERDGEDRRQRELGAEHALPHAGEVEGVEPEVVGVEAGDARAAT